jgi:hypothetical protein
MPNINVDLQPVQPLRPSETGIEADIQSAYRGRSLYDQAAQGLDQAGREIGGGIAAAGQAATDYIAHREVSAGAAHSVQMFDSLSRAKDEAIKAIDPTDPNYGAKVQTAVQQWREQQLEPALEDFQKGFLTQKGQDWSERTTANIRDRLFLESAGDIRHAAGIQVDNTANGILNSASDAAFRNPGSMDHILALGENSIKGLISTSSLRGTDAAKAEDNLLTKLHQSAVMAGVQGAIMNSGDPEAIVQTWAARYPKYINGAEADRLARTAKVQRRMLDSYGKANLLYQRELDNQGVAAARNQIWSDNVAVDPGGKVTINPQFFKQASQIPAKYPNSPQAIETAKTLLDWGERQSRPEKITSDPAVMSELDNRMFAQEDPTSNLDILKAEAAGKISRQDGAIRLELVKAREATGNPDPVLQDALRNARNMIEPTILGGALGGQRIGQDRSAAFQLKFFTEYQKEKAAGTLPSNALDLNDPKSLISQTLSSYRPSLAQSVLANGGVGGPKINTAPPPSAAFKPPADWLVNRARGLYRDPAGNFYDLNGKPVKVSGPAT